MKQSLLLATALMLGSPCAAAGESLVSIDPWLSEETGVTDVSLEGKWEFYWGCVRFVPHRHADFVYDVPLEDCQGGGQIAFTASLHRVDERLLLVVGPKVPDEVMLVLPVYWLFKVELDDDTMNLFSIDHESFDWRAAGASIEHKNGLVLSPTEDLMAFLSWQVGDFSFFEAEPEYTLRKIESDN